MITFISTTPSFSLNLARLFITLCVCVYVCVHAPPIYVIFILDKFLM